MVRSVPEDRYPSLCRVQEESGGEMSEHGEINLEPGQLWQSKTGPNGVIINAMANGVATWTDRDNKRVSTPIAALAFRLNAEFDLAPFKISPDFKPRWFAVISQGETQ